MTRTRAYRDGVLYKDGFPVEEVSDFLAEPDTAVWVDLCEPSEADLTDLAGELGLHRLAVEDAVQEHQRPKLDRYDGHAFLTAYAVRFDPASGRTTTYELAVFITPRALVTVRKDDGFDVDAVTRRWDLEPDLAKSGVPFLLHGLLDHVVDGHFDAVQALDDQVEELEDLVFDDRPDTSELQRRSFELRKNLTVVRRVVGPVPDVLGSLMRRDLRLADDTMGPYFEDVHDHARQAAEHTEALRERLATVRETQLNLQSDRLNLIMKKVTGWAAVIAVPTAVTGFYGQNVAYPGNGTTSGFWVSTVVMLVLSIGLYALFKKKDWL
ncbi:Magnesium and cobalt transport protein CorA [Amycolatopsis camponoti]|uniref:Magnesium and cobalt transport protein CorA n=1 Tax=Amycolatopsis camponoti TaxID=2606593 RepID=A0A6I8LSM8_9PSEU|nr:magnesium transporter CorA family protein [Amycolatopsis camponoti]VVJ18917.1 Magnesium and cobalt transport protein CorA [Amycolatopsis camponoti]